MRRQLWKQHHLSHQTKKSPTRSTHSSIFSVKKFDIQVNHKTKSSSTLTKISGEPHKYKLIVAANGITYTAELSTLPKNVSVLFIVDIMYRGMVKHSFNRKVRLFVYKSRHEFTKVSEPPLQNFAISFFSFHGEVEADEKFFSNEKAKITPKIIYVT